MKDLHMKEVLAWFVALPVTILGGVCIPLMVLGLPWTFLFPLLFFLGATSFYLLLWRFD